MKGRLGIVGTWFAVILFRDWFPANIVCCPLLDGIGPVRLSQRMVGLNKQSLDRWNVLNVDLCANSGAMPQFRS
jgi:hypothetical protein